MAVGPLLYFYIQKNIKDDYKITRYSILHFIPYVISLIYIIPFLFQSGEYKMQAFLATINTGDLGEPYFLPFFRGMYNIIYFIISMRLILRYKRNLPNTASNIDNSYHRWLIFFSSFLLLPMLSLTIFAVNGLNGFSLELVYLSIFLFLASIYLFILFKPSVFKPFPHQLHQEPSGQEKSRKYEKSNLKNAEKDRYLKKLEDYMDSDKPYRKPELTLHGLSKQINISPHHLSQIINEKLNCHFLDFINGHRIEEAKEKLVDQSNANYTIESIAYEVGFNSKSTFYTAFKKVTKTTPAKFRNSPDHSELF